MSGLNEQPKSIQNLVKHSIQMLSPVSVILFGSRARGDHREDSDFDLAFVLSPESKRLWSRFCAEVNEEAYTLYDLDLVDWDQLDSTYKNNIKNEGVVLYGKTPA